MSLASRMRQAARERLLKTPFNWTSKSLGEPIGKPGKPFVGLFGGRAAGLPIALSRGCNLELDVLLCWLVLRHDGHPSRMQPPITSRGAGRNNKCFAHGLTSALA
jgi:hypothetical protein